jgi:sulfoxide reductase heme-binding subunit YedZ
MGAAIYALLPPADVRHRISFASAYVTIVYLVVSFALGPYRLWQKLHNPISFDLRRDVGIWVGVLALLHTIVGLTVHLRGRMWMYFLKALHPPRIQLSLFGFANYIGAVATIVFVILLVISNDLSLRKLGTSRWKSIQRWSYIAAGLTVIHGFAYQFVEKRQVGWILLLIGSVVAALGIQAAGFVIVRRGVSGQTAR